MLGAGNTNIPDGGVTNAGVTDPSVLDPNDPNAQGCTDPMDEFADFENPNGPQSVDQSIPVEEAPAPEQAPQPANDAFANSAPPPQAPQPQQTVMTKSQQLFFAEEPVAYVPVTEGPSVFNEDAKAVAAEREAEVALADLMDPDSIMAAVLGDLESTPPPMSSIEAAEKWSPLDLYIKPQSIPKSAFDGSADLVGVEVDGRAYVEDVARGVRGLEQIEAFVNRSPDEMAKMSPHELREMRKALKSYGVAAQEVYNEGISYGWTPTHAMEGMVNQYYSALRAKGTIDGARQDILNRMSIMPDDLEVKVRGEYPEQYEIYSRHVRGTKIVSGNVNMGISMTDLNKRDPSGNLGDAVRDRLRELTNEHLGRNDGKKWDAKRADTRLAADNVSSFKGSTVAVIGVTEAEAREGMDAIQTQLQREMDSGKILKRIDPEVRKDIDLSSRPQIRVKGHYSESSLDCKRPGEVESKALRSMATMSLGEDMASKRCVKKGAVLVKDKPSAAAVDKATHTVFGVFKSDSPGREMVFDSKGAPEGPQVIERDHVKRGEVLRPQHDFGHGVVHRDNIEAKYAKLESAVEAFRKSGVGTPEREQAIDDIRKARADLRIYLETPYGERADGTRYENNPGGKSVSERLRGDFDRSRNVYRFRSKDGEGLMVLKRGHMGEVITSRSKGAKGKQWLVAMEMGKVGDYMKKHAAIDGIKDPSFAQFFEIMKGGLSRKGFDVEMAVVGGDEFLLHLKEREGVERSDAELEKALKSSIGEFESKHPRKHTYSEKTSMPGGKWNGINFGVTEEGRVVYMESDKASKADYAKLNADPKFRATVKENFPNANFDGAEIRKKKTFMAEGEGVRRHDVHRVPNASGKLEMDGHKTAERELYLRSGSNCKTEGAVRPERMLTAEATYMPKGDGRNLEADINQLSEGAQENKSNGDRVTKVKRSLKNNKAVKGAANAGSFIFASLGSKFIAGAVEAVAEGDTDKLIESVGAEEIFHAAGTWGAMTVGTVGAKTAFDALERKIMKRLSPQARQVLRTRYAGARARMAGGMALIGGIAAAEFAETGEVDAVGLINSVALIKMSQVIVGSGAEAWQGVRSMRKGKKVADSVRMGKGMVKAGKILKGAKNLKALKSIGSAAGGPLKMLAEFVVMEGLGKVEERVIAELERSGRRGDLADAMLGYDRAVSDAVSATGSEREARMADVGEAYGELMNAYGDCMEFEKYTQAEEFQPVANTMEEVETHGGRLQEVGANLDDYDGTMTGQRVTLTEGHMRWLPEHGDYHVGQRITQGEWLAAQRDRLVYDLSGMEDDLTARVDSAEVEFRGNTADQARGRSGADFEVPFAYEGGGEEMEIEYEYGPPETYREAMEAREGDPEAQEALQDMIQPGDRWHQALPDNPHEMEIFVQYTLKKAERALMESALSDDGHQTSF